MKNLFMAASAGALLLVLVFAYDQSEDLRALGEQVDALKAKPQEGKPLVREVRTVLRERTVVSEPTAVLAAASASSGAAVPNERTPEEREYRDGVIIAAQTKAINDVYQQQSADPAWSERAATLLTEALSTEGIEGWSTRSECRETICKVDFSWTDDSRMHEANPVTRKRPWQGQGFSNVNLETKSGWLYVAREGTQLPRVDVSELEF